MTQSPSSLSSFIAGCVFRSLIWQAVWFLYFQNVLCPRPEAAAFIRLRHRHHLLEVPSGYMSDRFVKTLIASAIAGLGGSFARH
jgi:hypothetical protein